MSRTERINGRACADGESCAVLCEQGNKKTVKVIRVCPVWSLEISIYIFCILEALQRNTQGD